MQGGSTITQQLAKNLFLSPDRTLKRKVQEFLLAMKLEQRFTTLTTVDGLPGDAIRTVLADKDGSLWAGTDGSGLAHLHDSTWESITAQQGLASNTILALAAPKDGSIAVGTPDGLDRLVNGRAAPAPHSDTLPDDFVRSLLYDPTGSSSSSPGGSLPAGGSLWIGTRRGLARTAP